MSVGRLLAWVVLLAGTVAAAQGLGAVPALHGVALSGETVDLPDALRGKAGVLVVGFSQASREEVTAWGKRLAADYRASEKVTYYEMPVLAGVPKLLRGYVVKKISADVPDRAKPRFLPIYEHEADWKRVAGYGSADEAYVLVVDGSGTVRWKFEGAPSDATYGEVKRRVESLRGE